jgi:hypothetical protein
MMLETARVKYRGYWAVGEELLQVIDEDLHLLTRPDYLFTFEDEHLVKPLWLGGADSNRWEVVIEDVAVVLSGSVKLQLYVEVLHQMRYYVDNCVMALEAAIAAPVGSSAETRNAQRAEYWGKEALLELSKQQSVWDSDERGADWHVAIEMMYGAVDYKMIFFNDLRGMTYNALAGVGVDNPHVSLESALGYALELQTALALQTDAKWTHELKAEIFADLFEDEAIEVHPVAAERIKTLSEQLASESESANDLAKEVFDLRDLLDNAKEQLDQMQAANQHLIADNQKLRQEMLEVKAHNFDEIVALLPKGEKEDIPKH